MAEDVKYEKRGGEVDIDFRDKSDVSDTINCFPDEENSALFIHLETMSLSFVEIAEIFKNNDHGTKVASDLGECLVRATQSACFLNLKIMVDGSAWRKRFYYFEELKRPCCNLIHIRSWALFCISDAEKCDFFQF